jgi:hypothetical protein
MPSVMVRPVVMIARVVLVKAARLRSVMTARVVMIVRVVMVRVVRMRSVMIARSVTASVARLRSVMIVLVVMVTAARMRSVMTVPVVMIARAVTASVARLPVVMTVPVVMIVPVVMVSVARLRSVMTVRAVMTVPSVMIARAVMVSVARLPVVMIDVIRAAEMIAPVVMTAVAHATRRATYPRPRLRAVQQKFVPVSVAAYTARRASPTSRPSVRRSSSSISVRCASVRSAVPTRASRPSASNGRRRISIPHCRRPSSAASVSVGPQRPPRSWPAPSSATTPSVGAKRAVSLRR